jgi:hypothetical protein
MVYKLSDNVIARIAQILQEGLLLGIDVVDLLRQIEVEVAPDGSELNLTDPYLKRVLDHHNKLLEELEALRAQSESERTNIVFDN